jgi:hypothetical protein
MPVLLATWEPGPRRSLEPRNLRPSLKEYFLKFKIGYVENVESNIQIVSSILQSFMQPQDLKNLGM